MDQIPQFVLDRIAEIDKAAKEHGNSFELIPISYIRAPHKSQNAWFKGSENYIYAYWFESCSSPEITFTYLNSYDFLELLQADPALKSWLDERLKEE